MPTVEWNKGKWSKQATDFTESEKEQVYGYRWGDPNRAHLRGVRDDWCKKFVRPSTVALEIGPGGGRWTQFLFEAKHVYLVDINPEMKNLIASAFPEKKNWTFCQSSGSDIPNVEKGSVDFVFSFGALVHMEVPIIFKYLVNLRPLLSVGADVVLHHSDKSIASRKFILSSAFSGNSPDIMRNVAHSSGYQYITNVRFGAFNASISYLKPVRG